MNKNKIILLALTLGVSLFISERAGAQTSAALPATTGTFTRSTPDTLVINTAGSTKPVIFSYTQATPYLDGDGKSVSVNSIQPGIPVTVFYEGDGNTMTAKKVVVGKSSAIAPAPSGIVSVGTPGKTLNTQVGMSPPNPEPAPQTATPETNGSTNNNTPSTPAMASSSNGSATPGSAPSNTNSGSTLSGVVTWVTTNEIQIKTPAATNPIAVIYSQSTNYTDEKGNPLPRETVTTGQQVIVNYTRQGDAMMANSVIIRREVGANEPASMHRRSATQGSGGSMGIAPASDNNGISR